MCNISYNNWKHYHQYANWKIVWPDMQLPAFMMRHHCDPLSQVSHIETLVIQEDTKSTTFEKSGRTSLLSFLPAPSALFQLWVRRGKLQERQGQQDISSYFYKFYIITVEILRCKGRMFKTKKVRIRSINNNMISTLT